MKILMVSMPSLHFFRWTEQLRDSGHEVYWFDVTGSGLVSQRIGWVNQHVNWKLRCDFPGRVFIKKHFPSLYKILQKGNEKNTEKAFEAYLKKVQPDVVHSFVIHLAAFPFITGIKKGGAKWALSTWGSDVYARSKTKKGLEKIKMTVTNIDYLFVDCKRDYLFLKSIGYTGELLGVYPGGGGYELEKIKRDFLSFNQRKILLIKGKQDKHGRCNSVLKALTLIKPYLSSLEIIVFGANKSVEALSSSLGLEEWENFYLKNQLPHNEVLNLMGRAKIYVGNSFSDGMPNTLLEAIIMGAFPIQTNPGGATAELIAHGKNGFLIQNPEDSYEIAGLLKQTIVNQVFIEEAVLHNTKHIKPYLDRELIKKQVLEAYKQIETELNNKA